MYVCMAMAKGAAAISISAGCEIFLLKDRRRRRRDGHGDGDGWWCPNMCRLREEGGRRRSRNGGYGGGKCKVVAVVHHLTEGGGGGGGGGFDAFFFFNNVFFLLVDPWAPSSTITMDMDMDIDPSASSSSSSSSAVVAAASVASQLFAASLFPYLAFLFHLTRSKTAPKLTLFGFYFLLAFVFATIPAGIYAKIRYGTSLANVDWLHGGAESLLTLTNLFIVLGLRKALREPNEVTTEQSHDVVEDEKIQ